jgi:hypothetical protein
VVRLNNLGDFSHWQHGIGVALVYRVSGFTMTVRLPKFISTLCLSIVLISSGTAWALQNCLMDNESAEHVHIAAGEFPAASSDTTRHNRTHGRIHCPENNIATLSFGPASPLFRLEPPDDGGGFLNSYAPASIATRLTRTIRPSIGPYLSPELIFSKLRI